MQKTKKNFNELANEEQRGRKRYIKRTVEEQEAKEEIEDFVLGDECQEYNDDRGSANSVRKNIN